MPVDSVGTGHPDGEVRAMPFGDFINGAAGVTASSAGTLLISAGTTEVAAYRSIVVGIRNSGANPVDITPTWTFYNSSGQYKPTETQRVAAGTSKALTFRNQGDLLLTLKAQGIGGNSTIEWYLAGSNHDPLPSSAPDYLLLFGVNTAIPSVPGGASGECQFDETSYQTNDASLWSFTLNGAGHIVEVLTAQPGRYESFANFSFAVPSAVTLEQCLLNVFGTIPLPNQMSPIATDLTASSFEGMVGAFSNYTTGTGQWSVQYVFDRNTSGAIVVSFWWIKRWAI